MSDRKLQPNEVSGKKWIVYFDKQKMVKEKSGRKQSMLRVLVECPRCHKTRWVRVNSIRNGKTVSSYCMPCARATQTGHVWKRNGITSANGYTMIHEKLLSEQDKLLAQKYLKKHRCYYYEHRLAAIRKYGADAVAPGIVVRHIDGNKTNNHPNNLTLGTQSDNATDHVTAIAAMKLWRGIAVTALRLLSIIGPIK